jgi:hypothetical protein
MSTTFNWSITQMQCLAQAEGHTDVVILASWNCRGASEVNGTIYTSDYSGANSFSLDPSAPFTPFDQLTQAQVLGWVWQDPNLKPGVEANVQVQIDRLVNPPVVTPPLPWVTPEVTPEVAQDATPSA